MNFNTVDAFNIIILKKTTLNNKDEHPIHGDNMYEKLNEILNYYDKVIFN